MNELARAETLDARLYCDPEVYEQERLAIFARQWILPAHESDLAQSRDPLAECLAGFPIFVIRGRDGGLRGFHDGCRHRAGPLVDEGRVRHALLRCRYRNLEAGIPTRGSLSPRHEAGVFTFQQHVRAAHAARPVR